MDPVLDVCVREPIVDTVLDVFYTVFIVWCGVVCCFGVGVIREARQGRQTYPQVSGRHRSDRLEDGDEGASSKKKGLAIC